MKFFDNGYDASMPEKPAGLRSIWGTALAFIAITTVTVIIGVLVSDLKYGMYNLLFVAFGLILLMLGLRTIPLVKANWKYLRPQLNRWHVMWYGIYMSALVWEIRSLESYRESPLDAFSILRLGPELFIGLYMVYLMGTGRVKWFASLFKGLLGVLAFYCLFCAVSSIWSVFPPWTLFKSIEYMLDTSVIAGALCVFTTTKEYRSLLDWTWTIFAVELVWVVMQIPIFPGQALSEGRLGGIFPLTAYNAVGTYSAVISVIAVCRLMPLVRGRFDRNWYASVFLFGVVMVIMSQTRNALGGLLGAIVVILLMNKRGTGIIFIGLTVGTVLYTALGPIIEKFVKRGQSADAFETLSGRLVWWHYAWIFFKERPWLGVGAYAGGKFAVLKQLHANSGSTHSDYIELLVGVGVIGTVLFATAILWTLVTLFRQWRNSNLSAEDRQTSMECFSVLFLLFIHSFFNVELTWHAPMFFLVCVGWAEFLRRKIRKAELMEYARKPIPQYRTSEIIFSEI